jgi:TM2 domain-containing membrane protein YozV/ribosomal protein S27E
MSDSVQIACPHCHQPLKVVGATAGRQVRCPRCHGIILVPDTADRGGGPADLWLVRTETGKVYGPVSHAELAQWVREGRVHVHCQVSPAAQEQWRWATDLFPELAQQASVLSSAPPAAGPLPTGPVSNKSRLIAGLLGLLMPLAGLNGIHRFYTGHIGLGILMLITCGGCGIWQLIDVILVFAGAVRDADGLPLQD